MKNDTSIERPETRTIALLAGLSIGLGLVLHETLSFSLPQASC